MNGLRPGSRRIAQAITGLLVGSAVLIGLGVMIGMIVTLPTPTTPVRHGRSGPWIEVPTWQVQACLLPILLALSAFTLWTLLCAVGAILKILRARARTRKIRTLALDETVVWRGRQGWRGLAASHYVSAGLMLIGPTLFTLLLWIIWSGDAKFGLKTMTQSLIAFGVLSGALLMTTLEGPDIFLGLYRNIFGTLVVTDRRLAWLSPRQGHIYREIEGTDILAAGIVEQNGQRGWICLSQQYGKQVREIDMYGIPQPHLALAAIERLKSSVK